MQKESKCLCCGSLENLTKDHWLPKSKGGAGKNNYVILCRPCNLGKADKVFENPKALRKEHYFHIKFLIGSRFKNLKKEVHYHLGKGICVVEGCEEYKHLKKLNWKGLMR